LIIVQISKIGLLMNIYFEVLRFTKIFYFPCFDSLDQPIPLRLRRHDGRGTCKSDSTRGRKGGRPPSMSANDIAHAKALLADPEITVEAVAKRMNVAASTLYRHLPGGRSNVAVGK
jgi:hypothetical protein